MRHLTIAGFLLMLLAACTPADEQYCRSFGVDGTTEHRKCLEYYHHQQAAFDADRRICDAEADLTYPPTLYDRGHTEQVFQGGFGHGFGHHGYGRHGSWGGQHYGFQTVFVGPDLARNAEVDRLRLRIVEPCMQARGWNSGTQWQAGRRPIAPTKRTAASSPRAAKAVTPLPWSVQPNAPGGNALPWLKP